MNDFVTTTSAIANALVQGRSMGDLLRLQVALQILSSLVNAEIAMRRMGNGE